MATLEEVRQHGHVLTPGRYVGAEAQEDDGEPFESKMRRLVAELHKQQAEGARLDAAIAANLRELGFAQERSLRCHLPGEATQGARTSVRIPRVGKRLDDECGLKPALLAGPRPTKRTAMLG